MNDLNLYTFILAVSILLAAGYYLLILIYRFWLKVSAKQQVATSGFSTGFSILIPARNEERNIEKCIRSIFANDYPTDLFEVLVVDDFSEDDTAKIVQILQNQYPQLRLIRLKHYVDHPINSYKKKAIETAILQSDFDFILTTDADCELSDTWLAAFDGIIRKEDPLFIAAPVKIKYTGTFLSLFQSLDFLSLQGITMAAVGAGLHTLCNGANLGYSKEAFYNVDGFKGVDDIASGDDMLLMYKIQEKFPGRIAYLLSRQAVVETQPMQTWRALFNQRIRWASKTGFYDDKKLLPLLLLVYFFNLDLLLLPVFSFWWPDLILWWLFLLLVKIVIELVFLWPVARFFGYTRLLIWFPFLQPFHIVYTVVAGFLGKFGNFEWKGRKVK